MRCFVILCILLCASFAPLKAEPGSSRIAAIVNSRVISEADLNNRLKFAAISSGLEPTQENMDQMKQQMLHMMIDEQLQLGVGEMYNLKIDDEQLAAAIKDIEQSNGMPEGTITELLEKNYIPLKTFHDQLRAQLTWVSFIRAKYPLKNLEDHLNRGEGLDFGPSLQIADWEIEQELKLQQEKDTKVQYHLAELFLPFDNAEQEERVKETFLHLIDELQKGAHFGALAQQFSQSATAAQGGDMGWLTEDQIEPEIKEYLEHLTLGQLSTPIRTSHGYTIIAYLEQKLPSSEPSLRLTFQNVLFPFPNDVTEDQARAIMEKAETIAKKSKSCSALVQNAKQADKQIKAHLAEKAPFSKIPPDLQKILEPLPLNKTSAPLLTEEGAMLVMVCDKETTKGSELTLEEVKDIVAGRKYSMLARRELRDLRRNAFINLRM